MSHPRLASGEPYLAERRSPAKIRVAVQEIGFKVFPIISIPNSNPFWYYSLYKPPFRVRSGKVALHGPVNYDCTNYCY